MTAETKTEKKRGRPAADKDAKVLTAIERAEVARLKRVALDERIADFQERADKGVLSAVERLALAQDKSSVMISDAKAEIKVESDAAAKKAGDEIILPMLAKVIAEIEKETGKVLRQLSVLHQFSAGAEAAGEKPRQVVRFSLVRRRSGDSDAS